MKRHHPGGNLGDFLHPKGATSPKKVNMAHPHPDQLGRAEGKLHGPKVHPGNVSKPRLKKV